MLEIRITAPELSEAINNLAKAMTAPAATNPVGMTASAAPTSTSCAAAEAPADVVQETVPVVPVANPTIPATAQPTVPTAQSAPSASYPTPETPVAPAPTIPTAAPQYTLEMLAKAGTALVDAGRIDELQALLAKFGVDALTSLTPAMYGACATELRALGAQI